MPAGSQKKLPFNMKNLFILFFLMFSGKANAQLKTDVLVLGGSASGTACAIQAARSGVKAILIEQNDFLISPTEPNLNIPAFNSGIWREWKNYTDSSKATPRIAIEAIIKKVKNLQLIKNAKVLAINEKKNGYTVKIMLNGKSQEIKAKLLVDASQNLGLSQVVKFGILKLNADDQINAVITYTTLHQKQPYQQSNKLYRTSIAAGFGKNSSQIFAIPAGVFIPNVKNNLLIINKHASLEAVKTDDFNLALWVSIGQATGGLAAYGPFFKTATKNANVRTLQSEVFNFKGQILPIIDVNPQDSAYKAIQQIIISSVLKLDFNTGLFYPDSLVNATDVKPPLCELFTRAKLWFAENEAKPLNLENLISLFSFISSRETADITREIKQKWSSKYQFLPAIDLQMPLTRKKFSVLVNDYLQPYKIRVDFEGNFIK